MKYCLILLLAVVVISSTKGFKIGVKDEKVVQQYFPKDYWSNNLNDYENPTKTRVWNERSNQFHKMRNGKFSPFNDPIEFMDNELNSAYDKHTQKINYDGNNADAFSSEIDDGIWSNAKFTK